tara:strand:- start:9662 stop:10225 length:564 start_codon:yes stop_codon:yes gene_type:complete
MSEQEDQILIKRIKIESKLADFAFKSYRQEKYGITYCCPYDLDKISIKKELCDWQDLKVPEISKSYVSEIYNLGDIPVPSWVISCGEGDADDCAIPEQTCLLFEIVDQDSIPVVDYEIILDSNLIGLTDADGQLYTTLTNAATVTSHIFDRCYCFETSGNCSQIKITLTLTEKCPEEACADPEPRCP